MTAPQKRPDGPVPFSPEWYADPAGWPAPGRLERIAAATLNGLMNTLAVLVGAGRDPYRR